MPSGEIEHAIFGHGTFHGRAFFAPVGNQLIESARIHHCARQNMPPHFGGFFHDSDRERPFGFLFEANGGRQTPRARAHNHNIIVHGFSCHTLSPIVACAVSATII